MKSGRTKDLPKKSNDKQKKLRSPDWLLVFSKFVKQGTSVATFVPSSRFLSRKIVSGINFDTAKCIVELGAGTGPITAELVSRIQPQTKLIIIERDPDFCRRLRERFPNVDVVEGDAAKLDQILAERGITEADHVVSGLPLPSFPQQLRDDIIHSSMAKLTPGGTFRQLTNMPWVYYRLYRSYFNKVKFRFVPLNFPPAGVYVCQSYRHGEGPSSQA